MLYIKYFLKATAKRKVQILKRRDRQIREYSFFFLFQNKGYIYIYTYGLPKRISYQALEQPM